MYVRAYREQTDGNPEGPMRFVASTEGIKRDGLNLRAGDWYLENYRRNPVFLWAHSF